MTPNGEQSRMAPVTKQRINVRAELINPEGVWEDTIVAEVDVRAPKNMIVEQLVIQKVLSVGGLVKPTVEGSDSEWEFIRLERVARIVVSFPTIELSSALPPISRLM